MAAGLDSLGAVELKKLLERMVGVELPVMAAFDHPSAAGRAGFVASVGYG
jgi:acyl carrier protein